MPKAPRKQRLDVQLVQSGLAAGAEAARRLIMAGEVYLGTQQLDKPGVLVPSDAILTIKPRKEHPYVSRGGIKLAHALDHFALDVTGRVALDIGSSTGGFTDVLLRRGATRVYAVDVGYGELDYRLRQDKRVVVLERMNARNLTVKEVPEPVRAVVCDVSFTQLSAVLPAALALVSKADKVWCVALIKPQFEVAKHEVGEGGIVTDPILHARVCEEASQWMERQEGWQVVGITPSPITGMKGNQEFLMVAQRGMP